MLSNPYVLSPFTCRGLASATNCLKQRRPWLRQGTPQCGTLCCESKYHSSRRRTLVRGGYSGLSTLTRDLILNGFMTFLHESCLQMSEIYAYAKSCSLVAVCRCGVSHAALKTHALVACYLGKNVIGVSCTAERRQDKYGGAQ